ncbi:hypothetical protein MVES_000887 [Malassezia vespertilionis]|uniref:Uncharacterized protein n=2 Tax=Malassezia vespertilionis TaxID=2020962 RepID=A0A2N1JF42_9BASI|nr:hypothetical protein MVES_000887 [Malassezia vespertilionis]
MRRAASETPPSAQTSLGLGARVMTPAQAAHAHPLRHKSSKHFSAPVPQKTARVPNVGTQIYRATPPSMDAQHGERIARILSPPSPSTEVRRAASPQTSPTASSAGKDEAELDAWDAKHERKMLDLEISNKSLLSVNATLEATKIKQTKELKALRQQLVLNRLEADSDANGSPLLEENMFPGLFSMDMIRNDDGLPAQVMRAMSRQDVELNEVLSRCRVSIDALINEARAAMVSRPDAAGRTVLHPSEYEKEEHEDMHTQPHNSLEAALILL